MRHVAGRFSEGRRPGILWSRTYRLAVPAVFLATCLGAAHAAHALSGEAPLSECVSDPAAERIGPLSPAKDMPAEFIAENGQRYHMTDIAFRPHNADNLPGMADQDVQLHAVAAGPEDRWGRIPAWIVATPTHHDAALLQAVLVRQGAAMFAPLNANSACASALLDAEIEARLARRGLWDATPRYATWQPQALSAVAGTYAVAAGRVISLGKTTRTRYLNFGRYWKTDVTASVPAGQDDAFTAALAGRGVEWPDLIGQAVEIRGFVTIHDGPHIELRHPAQLRVLKPEAAKP